MTVFSVTGGLAGIIGAWAWRNRRPSHLMAGSLALATVPLLVMFMTRPGGPAYFVSVAAAGFLLSAGIPATVATTTELAPRDVAAATGVLLGLTNGLAGALYLGIGQAPAVIGLEAALRLGFVLLIPAAWLTMTALICGPRRVRALLPPFAPCTCPARGMA